MIHTPVSQLIHDGRGTPPEWRRKVLVEWLAANGGYTSTTNALLNCALGGTTAGAGYGRLQVAGAVTLNGALNGMHRYSGYNAVRLTVGVLVISIIAEAVSMRACLVEVNKARGSRSLTRWFRESRQAELIVIFGEDLAARSLVMPPAVARVGELVEQLPAALLRKLLSRRDGTGHPAL